MPKGIRGPERCTVAGCDRRHSARGYCSTHYTRWKRHGDPNITLHDFGEPGFWPRVDKDGPLPEYRPDLGPCWLWTGAQDGKGYGKYNARRVHRTVYEELVGPIPPGLQLDHLCRVRRCCNPAHLEPVTGTENVRRGVAAQRSFRREYAEGASQS